MENNLSDLPPNHAWLTFIWQIWNKRFKKHLMIKLKIQSMASTGTQALLFSCSVVSDSFVTPWAVTHQDPVLEISQARILEWVAISFSRGFSWPSDRTYVCCIGRQVPLSHQGSLLNANAYIFPTTSWHLKAWTEREKTQKNSLLLLRSTRTPLHETQRFLGFSHRCSKRTHDFGLLGWQLSVLPYTC